MVEFRTINRGYFLMPSKLFQKRKAEAARRAERERANRQERKRILIITEGSKTEPNYIDEFVKLSGLTQLDIYLPRDHITSPRLLVDKAKSILSLDKDYDKAFVICDRDEFEDFELAKNAASQINCIPRIQFIYSDPCFEFWLLLHYEPCTSPMDRHEALQRLRDKVPSYEKGAVGMGALFYERTDIAVQNSISSFDQCAQTGGTCPSTLMHLVIEALRA